MTDKFERLVKHIEDMLLESQEEVNEATSDTDKIIDKAQVIVLECVLKISDVIDNRIPRGEE